MFCNNCGSKLPDGSRFCSVCGTRLVDLEPTVTEAKPVGNFGYAEDARADADKSETYETATARVSFDWSNVIEEPIKKVVPEIRSPWVEPVVEERPAVEKPSIDHRRTMSFIEILKQEREEKLKAAELEAQAVTARQEASPDYSAFDNVTHAYDDVDSNAEEPIFEEPAVIEPIHGEPVVEEPVFEDFPVDRPEYEEPAPEKTSEYTEEPAYIEEPVYAEEPIGHIKFENEDFADFAPPLQTLKEETSEEEPGDIAEPAEVVEEPSVAFSPSAEGERAALDFNEQTLEELHEKLSVEDFYNQTLDFGEAEPSNLEAELDAILNAGAGRMSRSERNAAAEAMIEEDTAEEQLIEEPAVESPAIDVSSPVVDEPSFDGNAFELPSEEDLIEDPSTDDTADIDFLDFITVTADEEIPEPETPVTEAAAFESPVFETPAHETAMVEEPVFDEPAFETDSVEETAFEEPAIETPIFEEPAFAEPVFEDDSDGPTIEEIVAADAAEPHDTSRATIVPVADEESEVEELKKRLAMLMGDTPAEAAEAVVQDENDLAGTESEDLQPEPKSDAISLDELEKELFGDVVQEDIESEATKKIDKFYTLYKKNEEFQKLLEEEYDKLKEADETQTAASNASAVEELQQEEPTEQPAEEPANEIQIEVPVVTKSQQPEEKSKKTERTDAKKAKKQAKKAAKKAEKSEADDEEESGGSGILTVLAVIVAVLLVVLLGVILVLNFAPDSGIAMTIDSVIENVASYFSDAEIAGRTTLL